MSGIFNLWFNEGFEDKTRGTLFFDIARIIKEKQPQAFVLENVKNLASHDGGKTLQTILETLRDELGYHVDYHLLNASLILACLKNESE